MALDYLLVYRQKYQGLTRSCWKPVY